ncbi:glycosyltransferase family 4 protein [Paraconexibacter antarcticus]|uniref:Glycosyltransferase family 4 protein n=1 Tax=Paraconexibacter antarcticus TaxID=2949664 RepID=A0ABY5DWM6_9ACTN|nr:glycosyltransferase family 4 protein [Paraconexibacter antarcticus]UTI65082.1 glycosyltransferase family 4 protein [Paraconexibacter antarcticus]
MTIALVIPQFRRGSGGHRTIADLVRGLETRGHALSLWLVDEEDRHRGQADAEVEGLFKRFFGPVEAPLRRLAIDDDAGVASGPGEVDVLVATGWQTVPTVLRTPGARRRAYLVQDHEPDFYPASMEREWAAWTYRQGLHCICASPWLAEEIRATYGASVSSFDLGVDHQRYAPLPTHRRDDLVLFYARAVTPRRAAALGVLALDELHRRRPDLEIAFFGDARPIATPFPYRHLGVLAPDHLAHAYASATVGLVLSMTNPSLVPTEMLACGLPVVDLATPAMTTTFGADGPICLTDATPVAIAQSIERLTDDLAARAALTRAGLDLAASRTWAGAAAQVEGGLREE